MSEVFSISGLNIHKAARASVISALYQVAGMKNVPLSPAFCDELAGRVLDRMDFSSIYQVSNHEQDGLTAMVQEINTHLDVTAMVRLRHLISVIEGKERLDDPAVEAAAQAIIAKVEATLPKQGCPRWPELMDMVSDYYATAPRGPIVDVRDDGGVCTTYWLGRELHRDPEEGPALHGVKGENQASEYWVKGQLHRDHRDGPAIIYTHYQDFDLSGEEYFENGKRHRPAELGPAVTHWDRNGEPVMKLYYENGEHHRDPSAGPAWWHIHDERTDRIAERPFIESRYCVRDQLHRDERDGPAWIKRDNETGVPVTEEYWRNGELHRDEGPASINRDATGKVIYEAWFRGGQLHRDRAEGPACTRRNLERRVTIEEFFEHGRQIDAALGPAWVERGEDGKIVEQLFWDGERMHLQRPEAMKAEASLHG